MDKTNENAAVRTGFIKIDENGNRIGTGVDGCEGWLMWLCLYEPRTYAALLARILPYFADVTHRRGPTTDEEIEAELREIGLPVELVEHLRKVPEELDWDEDPDPYGMMKDVTPPAGDTVDAVAVDTTSANNGDKAEESLDDALSKLSPEERAIVEARAEELRKQAEAQSKDPIE